MAGPLQLPPRVQSREVFRQTSLAPIAGILDPVGGRYWEIFPFENPAALRAFAILFEPCCKLSFRHFCDALGSFAFWATFAEFPVAFHAITPSRRASHGSHSHHRDHDTQEG
jgi:hypothetical protein